MIGNGELLFYMVTGYSATGFIATALVKYLTGGPLKPILEAHKQTKLTYNLSTNLNALRLARQESFVDLAASIGLSATWVSRLCRSTDQADPSLNTLKRFSAHFGVSVIRLLGGDDPAGSVVFRIGRLELYVRGNK